MDTFGVNCKETVVSTSACGQSSMPDKDDLKSLKSVCPSAVFFKCINLCDEETETASDRDEVDKFPKLLTSVYADVGNVSSNICQDIFHTYNVTVEQIKKSRKCNKGSVCLSPVV